MIRRGLRGVGGRRWSVLACFGLWACAAEPPPEVPPEAVEPEFSLRPVGFDQLPGWQRDVMRDALRAFLRSCARFTDSEDSRPVGTRPVFGHAGDWRPVCEEARTVDAASPDAARRFFEDRFQPYLVLDGDDPEGLFTGYYEPVLHGSRRFGERYRIPLYRRPSDLLRIDLGRFNPELAGYAIYGRVAGEQFVPYHSRAAIESGALAGRGLELVWVDDPIDKFFLQVQGSGQIRLEDGSVIRVGYAAPNGHPYRAIGRDLIEIEAIGREEMSLQAIRAWLQANPEQADDIMSRNRSYIFFEEHADLAPADGPLGAEGVPLTAGRSLAVDPRYIAFGVPVWVDTEAPWPEGHAPLRRLMVAQDTGGAVRGVVRGDVFWGAGERAEAIAGPMKSAGRYAVLLPRTLIPVG